MPNLIDGLSMKYNSTEVTVLSTDRVLQNVSVTGSTFYGITLTSDVGQTVSFPTTASAAINNYGVVVVGSSTAAQAFDLPLPSAAGQTLTVLAYTALTSDCPVSLVTTAANLIDYKYKTILMQPWNWVTLVGISTALGWALIGTNTTTLGQSTSLIALTS